MCNVYTIRSQHVANKLDGLFKEYKLLKDNPKLMKKEKFYDQLRNFKSSLGDLLDIKCNGRERIKS